MNPAAKNYWLSWRRLVVLGLTVIALVLLFRRIDAGEFGAALGSMQPGWFFLGVLVYGSAFLFGAWRWHLTLRLTGCAVHASASARLYCIGHYFFIILFGGVPGDIAKSTLYSRWYGRPFTDVFAASPLDRLLGLGGLIIFGATAFAFAAANQSLAHLESVQLRWPGRWAGAVVAIVILVLIPLIWWRPTGQNPAARLLRAMQAGGRGLWTSPWIAVKGLACGVLVQVALSAVLALNLQAVTSADLPWRHMLWTFPVISMLSSLPITVAGLGVREGAAALLLGLYGVPASEAVAASLLTLAAGLVWAALGGWLLWREEQLRARPKPGPAPETISVVIPALNEAANLPGTIERLRAVPEVKEIIVVDGGSTDETADVAAALNCQVIHAPRGRGSQMSAGARAATGDVILLLHADTWVPASAGRALLDCLRDPVVVGGGFWKVFRGPIPFLLLGSKWKCAIRFYLGRRVAGDQGIFIRRTILEQVGGVPEMPLMEEFELCRRLHKVGRLGLADVTIATSARRFARFGVLRTYLRMWYVTTRYRLGTAPQELCRIYEHES